jgi:hypothetical protein
LGRDVYVAELWLLDEDEVLGDESRIERSGTISDAALFL